MNLYQIDALIGHYECLARAAPGLTMHWSAQAAIAVGQGEFSFSMPIEKRIWALANRFEVPIRTAVELYYLGSPCNADNAFAFDELAPKAQSDTLLKMYRHLRATGNIEVTM